MSILKRPLSVSLAALALALAAPASALAGHGHGHGHFDWKPTVTHGGYHGVMRYDTHPGHGHGHRHGGHHRGHHGRHHGSLWGPLIVGGLVGAAIVGASQAHAQPAPPAVVLPVMPPSHLIPAPAVPPLHGSAWGAAPVAVAPISVPVPAAPPRVHYYCAPYRAYHPQVAECPAPWTPIPY